MAMKRKYRLTDSESFRRVYRRGQVWSHPLVALRALPNHLAYSRCGFATNKRIGKAVVRNRVKRWMREAVRQEALAPGWDLVFVAREGSQRSSFIEIRQVVRHLLNRARLSQV